MMSSPTIWTPRAGSWWRLPRWTELFTEGKVAVGSNGKVKTNADGKATVNTDDSTICCGCKRCPAGQKWRWVTVSFTGLNYCSGCITAGSIFTPYISVSGSADLTFVLPLTESNSAAGNCWFQYDEVPPVSASFSGWTNSGCTTPTGRTIGLRVQVVITGNITAQLVVTENNVNLSYVFRRESAPYTQCDQTISLTNGLGSTSSSCGSFGKAGYGGTCDITFQCAAA